MTRALVPLQHNYAELDLVYVNEVQLVCLAVGLIIAFCVVSSTAAVMVVGLRRWMLRRELAELFLSRLVGLHMFGLGCGVEYCVGLVWFDSFLVGEK